MSLPNAVSLPVVTDRLMKIKMQPIYCSVLKVSARKAVDLKPVSPQAYR
jgi:hypothetical protein